MKPRSPHSPSYIPVVAPRQTRSTLPSSLSLPQLNLAPLPRRPSGSSPSVGASPMSSNSNIPQTLGSGISPFRSLRNFLPFGGGGKQQASSTPTNGINNGHRSSFGNFGSVRRSITGERKSSASFPKQEESEPSPVISIEASPQQTDSETDGTYPYDSASSSIDHISSSPGSRASDISE